jgi:hypothetical protein
MKTFYFAADEGQRSALQAQVRLQHNVLNLLPMRSRKPKGSMVMNIEGKEVNYDRRRFLEATAKTFACAQLALFSSVNAGTN